MLKMSALFGRQACSAYRPIIIGKCSARSGVASSTLSAAVADLSASIQPFRNAVQKRCRQDQKFAHALRDAGFAGRHLSQVDT